MDYLLKTEPDAYSFSDLEKDKETLWDGVTNPAAVKHLREMRHGDKLVVYHTGDERKAVGTATVSTVQTDDPKKPQVRIKAGKQISSPKALSDIKSQKVFTDSPLVTQGRLSVVPLSDAQYHWLVDG